MTQDSAADGRLVLTGALTVRSAEAVRKTLCDAIAQNTEVRIDCSGAEEVDLSLIQLLLAARASARLAGKVVALADRPDGTLLDTLTRGGFCVTEEDASQPTRGFWFEGAAT